ncbi:DUF5133 domain-containing protein, partial [Streptomyces afghaniensis]|uniref:DUF5133 domain-containing protein n=1 Tax=Streptomyces afghaniensis TaxID=66865 RepID=UPI000561C797
SGYTLCVLMGKRCAREAADAAERYLRTNQVAPAQEQNQVTCLQEQQVTCLQDRRRPSARVAKRARAALP